jgi:4-hydroxy-3-methylbut-2-en-1-yl diphosphate synthase IspG/GcpE
MAARDLKAWKKRADGTRRLRCPRCGRVKAFTLVWGPVQKQEAVRTAHHKRVIAVCECGLGTRVVLGGPR